MIISAIKFQVSNEEKPRLYRFQTGDAKRRHLFLHSGTPEELEDFGSAILFALRGKSQQRIIDVILHVSDNNGDAWIIERTRERVRIFRNRQQITSHGEEQLRTALFDLDIIGNFSGDDAPVLAQRLDLFDEDEQLVGYQITDEDHTGEHLRNEIKTRMEALLGELKDFLATRGFLDVATVQKLVDGLERPFTVFRELSLEQKKLAQESRQLAPVDVDLISRLEAEADLMERLRLKAAPLLDPARSPQVLKEKLNEIETKLTSICRKHDIASLPANQLDVPWEKLLTVLARLKSYQQLQSAYENCLSQIDEKIAPVFDEYLETIDQLLQNDTQITTELECCLSSLTLQMRRDQQKTEPKNKWVAWLERYLRKSSGGPAAPTKALVRAEEHPDDRLENARMAVDYALGRLGELHSNLAAAESLNLNSRNAIRDFHEKLVSEYGKLRKNWEILATKYQLPQETSIKSLLGLIQHYGQISELMQKSEEIRRELKQYRHELNELEALVQEWRHVSGSQKENSLDTPSILLAEARGILEYQEQKQNQLRKIKEQEFKLAAHQQLAHTLKNRLLEAQAQWRTTFERLALPVKDIVNEGWPEFFAASHRFLSLVSLSRETLHPVKHDRIFSSDVIKAPLALISLRSPVVSTRGRLQLISQLDKGQESNAALLLVADQVLADQLAKAGLCTSVPVTPQRKSSEGPSPQADAKLGGAKLSDRAQAALRVFQAQERRNNSPSRD